MALIARLEGDPDLAQTARLATEAFEARGTGFTAERLAWLYGRAFCRPTAVIALFADGRKVGQVALVGQGLGTGPHEARAAALMDLFILPTFRSRQAIETLYGAVERHCVARGIETLLAVPNGRAVGVNRRFLKLDTAATLDIRVGAMPPVRSGRLRLSAPAASLSRPDALALFDRYLPQEGRGLRWTGERLWARLQEPGAIHGLHATDELLLVSSRRRRRGLSFALLGGFFARPGSAVEPHDVRAVVAAACRLQRRPLFVYVGVNAAVPLPGLRLPARLRPSPMIVQARAMAAEGRPVVLDRFEGLDFDLA